MKEPRRNTIAYFKQEAADWQSGWNRLKTDHDALQAKLQMAEAALTHLQEANRMWMGHAIVLGRTIDQMNKDKSNVRDDDTR